ncbi:MarR family winged helix-turn-helix transcriptional regulator [Psychromonas antarctica]|uniref:MarR family winged helix-turn-helix transcriptional regulator n=1 Tax=Psychromonas antarctica TaxID=67573 RepID=UPI001EE7DB64|nr:MarR family transcriptional regulator [Psychromonas antarctica]MCG6200793.1 MarR family transcriptional regulator [Psychromonas antarctica]
MDKLDRVVEQWQIEKPHLDTQPMALIGRLLRLSKYLQIKIAQCHKSFGLTLGEFDVLATLRRATPDAGLTPSELINAMMLTSGAMTNRLDKLECKALISRKLSQLDKRSVTVSLTGSGRELIDSAIEAHVAMQHELLCSFNTQQKALLNEILKTWLIPFESNDL